jgi:pimeloyl-ACP methyl ester carboxylesterase
VTTAADERARASRRRSLRGGGTGGNRRSGDDGGDGRRGDGGQTLPLLVVALALVGFRVAAERRETAARRDAAPNTGRFVRAADVDVFVQEEGPSDGPAVVLVHGTGAWSEIWRGTMHALAGAGYRAIALDMPPFGFSARPANTDYGDEAQARRILGVLDALRLQRATLVGHSFGGRPTMQATFLSPGRVERLVLVDAALDLARGCVGGEVRGCDTVVRDSFPARETSGPWLARAVLGAPTVRDAVVSATLSNPGMTGWLLSKLVANREAAITPARLAMLQRPFVLEGWTPGLAEWLAPFATTRTSSLATTRKHYTTLAMPTLVLGGARDALTPMDQGRDIARLIPGARWEVLPAAGHIPAIEDQASFDAALLEFLRTTSAQ